ncbi:ATP-binding protein [Chitinimonas sp.]|uniref:ATP-binding protein n=1 Tax=Chitinimonas sp. TaxID=1934313 RepID=UPI0035AE8592
MSSLLAHLQTMQQRLGLPPSDVATERPGWQQFDQCATHGTFALNFRDEHGAERWHPAGCPACAAQADARRLLGRAEVGKRFLDCTFDNYLAQTDEQKKALARCRNYAEHFREHHAAGRSMILRGNPGTGKNHLAAAIVLSVLREGFTALQSTAYELVTRIKETWGKDAEGREARELEVIRRFASVDLLVIDEVGRQFGKEADQILLFHILDGRYRNGLPTIVISNKTTEEIEQYLTPAGFDRLRQNGGRMVQFNWQSNRGAE